MMKIIVVSLLGAVILGIGLIATLSILEANKRKVRKEENQLLTKYVLGGLNSLNKTEAAKITSEEGLIYRYRIVLAELYVKGLTIPESLVDAEENMRTAPKAKVGTARTNLEEELDKAILLL